MSIQKKPAALVTLPFHSQMMRMGAPMVHMGLKLEYTLIIIQSYITTIFVLTLKSKGLTELCMYQLCYLKTHSKYYLDAKPESEIHTHLKNLAPDHHFQCQFSFKVFELELSSFVYNMYQ